MAAKGQTIFDMKCGACHKLTEERLVGPGWKGVTSRHTPEWIMNFATNVDEMLNKDPKAQASLKYAWCECQTRTSPMRMPGVYWNSCVKMMVLNKPTHPH